MKIILALLIGAAFGAVLDRSGATNPSVLGRMLALRSLGIMKAILLAIGITSILTFGGQMLGLVDVGHMSVKATHAGVFLGGLILGVGWAMSGFCPGTGVCAAAAGRRDAMIFILGGLLGALAYTFQYSSFKAAGLMEPIAGGKVTIGLVPGSKYEAVFPSLPGDLVGIALGLVFVAIAFALPDHGLKSGVGKAQPAE